jgi:hypothetical protein
MRTAVITLRAADSRRRKIIEKLRPALSQTLVNPDLPVLRSPHSAGYRQEDPWMDDHDPSAALLSDTARVHSVSEQIRGLAAQLGENPLSAEIADRVRDVVLGLPAEQARAALERMLATRSRGSLRLVDDCLGSIPTPTASTRREEMS